MHHKEPSMYNDQAQSRFRLHKGRTVYYSSGQSNPVFYRKTFDVGLNQNQIYCGYLQLLANQ